MKKFCLPIFKVLIFIFVFFLLVSSKVEAAPVIKAESTGTRVDKGENVRFVITGITNLEGRYRVAINSSTYIDVQINPQCTFWRGGSGGGAFNNVRCQTFTGGSGGFTFNLNTTSFDIPGLSKDYTATLTGPGTSSTTNFTVYNLAQGDDACDRFEVNMPSTIPKNTEFRLQVVTNCSAASIGGGVLKANFFQGNIDDAEDNNRSLAFASGVFSTTFSLSDPGSWNLALNPNETPGLQGLFDSAYTVGTIEVTDSNLPACGIPISTAISCPDECNYDLRDPTDTSQHYCLTDEQGAAEDNCQSPETIAGIIADSDRTCKDDGREITEVVSCGVIDNSGSACNSTALRLCHQDGQIKCEAVEGPEPEEPETISCPVCPDSHRTYNRALGLCCSSTRCVGTIEDGNLREPDEDLCEGDIQACIPGRGCTELPGAGEPPCLNRNEDGTCEGVGFGDTALGLFLPTTAADFIRTLLGILLSVSGMIAVALIIRSGYQYMLSRGNPDALQEARDRLTSAIVGLLFIIFSLVILQVIGVDILGIPGIAP